MSGGICLVQDNAELAEQSPNSKRLKDEIRKDLKGMGFDV